MCVSVCVCVCVCMCVCVCVCMCVCVYHLTVPDSNNMWILSNVMGAVTFYLFIWKFVPPGTNFSGPPPENLFPSGLIGLYVQVWIDCWPTVP